MSDVAEIHARPQIVGTRVRHSVQLISEIPRTGSGKIIRYKLRELIKGEAAELRT